MALPGSSVVSYGMNGNLANLDGLSSSVASAKTVLLFEVSGSRALLSSPDEGATIRPGTFRLVSAEGTGTYGSILDWPMPYPGPTIHPDRFTLYATGVLDNAQGVLAGSDDFDEPRHGEGANFLALDLHATWSRPKAISGGNSAKEPSHPQSPSGCRSSVSSDERNPCAEGTAHGGHKLTFSAR